MKNTIYDLQPKGLFFFSFSSKRMTFFFMYFKHNIARRCEQNDKKDSSSMIQIY